MESNQNHMFVDFLFLMGAIVAAGIVLKLAEPALNKLLRLRGRNCGCKGKRPVMVQAEDANEVIEE